MRTVTISDEEYELIKNSITTKWFKHEIKGKILEWGDASPYKMTWKQAKIWCEEHGGRLPTDVELLIAYEQKIEGFLPENYWSTSPISTVHFKKKMYCDFHYVHYYLTKPEECNYVRCVRDIK
jgi:hypothetical protein